MTWFMLLPRRFKLIGIVLIAFCLGLLGLRAHWSRQAVARERERIEAARNRAIRQQRRDRHEVSQMDDVSLADRIARRR